MTPTDPPSWQPPWPTCPSDDPVEPANRDAMTPEEVHEALLSGVDGHLPSIAAVDLLIAHGSSIGRLETAGLIEWSDPQHQPPMAWIDWYGLDDQLSRRTHPHATIAGASTSTHNILHIAASLTTDHQIALGDVLCGLDSTNTTHVTRAVADAYGQDRYMSLQPRSPASDRTGRVSLRHDESGQLRGDDQRRR